LFNAVTGKPVSTARLLIEIDLPSNTFIEHQKTFIFRIRKIHHATLAAEREAYLKDLFFLSQRRESRLKGSAATRPFPKHSLQGGGYILRPGCAGCWTLANPVPSQAGHFTSAIFRLGIFIRISF
jgi:hypothetical protein